MRRLLLLTALAVVLFTGSARAAYQVLGPGVVSCGTWTANRASGRPDNWLAEGSWVLGFLSGVGYRGEGFDPLHGLDARAVAAWLDNYCRAHLFQDLAEAAAAFVREHPH